MSAGSHVGRPIVWMFAYIVSATVLFMCCGQADPRRRDVTSVSVIIAAALAIVSPISRSSLMCS